MRRTLTALAGLAVIHGFPVLAGSVTIRHYTEHFSTTQYKDAGTTSADWNTATGLLSLPLFSPSFAGTYNTVGNAKAVHSDGNRVFVADGSAGLVIVDVSNPANPTLIGSHDTPGDARDVVVSGNHAYVADGAGGMQIIDVTNPAMPVLAGVFAISTDAIAVRVDGDRAFLSDAAAGLYTVDISNPATPVQLGIIALTPALAPGIAIDGSHLFVANSATGLEIYDVSDPSNPVLLGTYGTSSASAVAVDGDLALLTVGAGIEAIDITDPASPASLSGVVTSPGDAVDVAISGNNAYVANGDAGMTVVDISDPANLSIRFTLDTVTYTGGIAQSGTLAFLASSTDGMRIVRVKQLTYPVDGVPAATSTLSWRVRVRGDHAFAAGATVKVLDITDVDSPSVVGSYPTIANTVEPVGDFAYVAALDGGLLVLDISDPTTPSLVGNYIPVAGRSFDVAVAGQHAYLLTNSDLLVIDVSNPASPQLAGSDASPQNGLDLELSGNLLYMADSFIGLRVYDVSDPTTPTQVGTYVPPTAPRALAVSGPYVFLGLQNQGFVVIDASDPSAPVAVKSAGSGDVADMVVAGDYLVVSRGVAGVQIHDISNPPNTLTIRTFLASSATEGVGISGNILLLSVGSTITPYLIFEDRWRSAQNFGQSLPVDEGGDNIVRTRLTTTQTDEVIWRISTDSGATWRNVTPDGQWSTSPLEPLDSNLEWRAELLLTSPGGPVPAVDALQIDWLYEFGMIDQVTDVPGDDGGWVGVQFVRSGRDFAAEAAPIIGYNIHQRVDNAALAARVVTEGERALTRGEDLQAVQTSGGAPFVAVSDGAATYRFEGRTFVVNSAVSPPGTWEVVGSVLAEQIDTYHMNVPTLADSGSAVPYQVYYVSAHTTTPSLFYNSPPDSGYSVDNLAPAPPAGFAVDYNTAAGNQLSWDAAPEPDFQFYWVYRDTASGFIPDPEKRVHATATPSWVDPAEQSWTLHYQISAVDYAGNESAAVEPETMTAIPQGRGRAGFAMYPNVPNPFNPTTSIFFDVPLGGSVLTIAIYVVAGRRIRTVANGRWDGGRHRVTWDGRDGAGTSVASGVYFYRMQAPGFDVTRKLVLIR